MKQKKPIFKFKKFNTGDWIGLGVAVVLIACLTYIVIRLIPKENDDSALFTYYAYKEPDPLFGVPEYVLENDKLRFELDPDTTQFTVTQKNTGRVWYSNPAGVEEDNIALVKEKNYMKSTLLLTYSTENGVNNTFDSFSYGVEKDYYTIELGGDSITVNYIIGEVQRIYIIPMALTEDDMDEYLEQFKKADSNIVKQYYRKYDIDNLNAQDDKAKLLADYPMLKNENVYVMRDTTPEYMKERIEKIFHEIGYSNSDYEKDLEMYAGGTTKNTPMFNVTVVYSIDDDALNIEIPFDKIISKKDYPLIKMAVLPYFGAGSKNDTGSLFVPEGGGALIHFNNTKNRQNAYYANVYGWNFSTDRNAVVNETRNSFPVFGITYEDSSFISILTDGSSYGGINADVSGRMNSYNTAYASYDMLHFEEYAISSKSNNAEFAYEAHLPEGERIFQKYVFVDSGKVSDMADRYGKYLDSEYNLKTVAAESTPVAVDIVGAVDKVQQFLGFPKSQPYELTSYSNTVKLVNELDQMGFNNMFLKLSGSLNGGLNQRVLTRIKYINKLGGKSEFKKMAEEISANHNVFLNGQVTYAPKNKLFDGFSMYRDSARQVSDELARLYPYSPIYYARNKVPSEVNYLVKPSFSAKVTDKFIGAVEDNNLTGVSFRDYGNELSCDFNEDRLVSREAVKKQQIEVFKDIKDRNLKLMVVNGNDYSLPYVDFIINMDFLGTKYLIIDEQVPFYQMAIHGKVNYAGEPINLSPSVKQAVLDAAAYGAGLSFLFTDKSTVVLQDTSYTELFGAGFYEWKDFAEEIYTKFNKELGHVFTKKMTGFENINAFVSKTEYEDGTVVYVNRGKLAETVYGTVTIPAEDYLVRHEDLSRGNK